MSDHELCHHLRKLEDYIKSKGAKETFRGKAWGEASRVWVYFDAVLDCDALKTVCQLDACVELYEYVGTHSGREKGFVCNIDRDGIMGLYPVFSVAGMRVVR